jgi:16S rRNA processing protein RimM
VSDSENELVVGAINGVYGIKGWVKVFSYTSPLEQILTYQPWILRNGAKHKVLKFAEGKLHGKGVIVLPEAFKTRSEAESLIGYEIRIDKALLPDLPEGEFYWRELQGMTVINEADEILGEVKEIIETGANDVLVVQGNKASIDESERLVPLVMDKVVLQVDTESREIRVNWASDY